VYGHLLEVIMRDYASHIKALDKLIHEASKILNVEECAEIQEYADHADLDELIVQAESSLVANDIGRLIGIYESLAKCGVFKVTAPV